MKIISNKLVENIRNEVQKRVLSVFPCGEISKDDNPIDHLDSLDLIEIVVFFEEKYSILVEDEDLEKVRNTEDIVRIIINSL